MILHKPKSKSIAWSDLDADMYSTLSEDNCICSQCGQDHTPKPMGGSAILNMISFLDRKKIR